MWKRNHKFQWMAWIRWTVFWAKRGDLERVAHWLACSLVNHDDPAVDQWGFQCMFTRPEFIKNAQELWKYMRPNITPEYLTEVENDLRKVGWAI